MSVRYRSGTAFREAIEIRLRSLAHGDPALLQRLRKEIVFDRLLARLIVVAPERWVLSRYCQLLQWIGRDRIQYWRDCCNEILILGTAMLLQHNSSTQSLQACALWMRSGFLKR